jgi:hypothetical protein
MAPFIAKTLLALALVCACGIAEAANLPRRAFFGAATTASPRGPVVSKISPGGTAAALSLKDGDVVLEIGRRSIGQPRDIGDAMHAVLAGSRIRVAIARGTRQLRLSGIARGHPKNNIQAQRYRMAASLLEEDYCAIFSRARWASRAARSFF